MVVNYCIFVAILFGSYSDGKFRKDSDIDLAVISEDFDKMGRLEKIELFANVAVYVDSRIELWGFSSKEYDSASGYSFLKYIKEQVKMII